MPDTHSYNPNSMKRAYKRRKSVKALAGAGRDVVLGCVATVGCVTLGGIVFGATCLVKGARRFTGATIHGKELLVYEALTMGSLLAVAAPLSWVGKRASDAQHITHQLLGLKPPRRKKPARTEIDRRL